MCNENKGLVYSTTHGRMCPKCGQPEDECKCEKVHGPVQTKDKISIRRETRGRRGKTMTVIAGLPLQNDKMRELSLFLKQKLGTGGTVKDNQILIQGNHCSKIRSLLKEKGYINISGP